MEARLARIESDIDHLKTDVAELRVDMKAANESIAAIKATIPHLATKADLKEVARTTETKLIKWYVGTALAIGAFAFSVAKFMD